MTICLMSNFDLTVYRVAIYSLAMSVKGHQRDGLFTVLFDKGRSRGDGNGLTLDARGPGRRDGRSGDEGEPNICFCQTKPIFPGADAF